jgi:hypothetical protein
MPSTDRKLELKAKGIDGSDSLTADCVLTDLASPAVLRPAVYAKGLKQFFNTAFLGSYVKFLGFTWCKNLVQESKENSDTGLNNLI